ncbi:putative virion structural protein [Erwinia phage vB_EamM_ChrisDB]|uniref:putative virion structural protein n=1 Tax=Erwinia phage vB_EamM_ChrisDB TaxID=1883371 RepID=UPI00081CD1CA|nr:putative virion structural protein [Erwinia phage vB_EamM_ChrisDB]ANZ48726.1 putative virion structural protein [Erwinia phage vB_EamM_ChrisDB]
MTIRLSWPTQVDKALTGIEIYRKTGWDATIDVYNPGVPLATLAGNATEFVENVANLTSKTIYKYWVAAVKGTERLFSQPITQGFYLDTGPGPQTLKRGDWYAGYFGTLTNAEFFNTTEIKQLLPAARGNLFQYDPQLWYKFVYKGRIIFVPSSRHATGYSFINAYAQGMAYGTDDNGVIVPSGAAATKQDAKISKDGRTYRIRLPYALDYAAAIGSSGDYNSGEWRNTMGRMFTGASANFPLQGIASWDSLALLGSTSAINDAGAVAVVPMYTQGTNLYAYGYSPMAFNTNNNVGSAMSMWFVFELILP